MGQVRGAAPADERPRCCSVLEEGTEALQEAIRNTHGCDSTWLESVPVHEKSNGQTVWDGEVQVFELVGRPKAHRCCAWSFATEGTRRRFMAVLGLGPVVDAVTVVRVAIAADAQRER